MTSRPGQQRCGGSLGAMVVAVAIVASKAAAARVADTRLAAQWRRQRMQPSARQRSAAPAAAAAMHWWRRRARGPDLGPNGGGGSNGGSGGVGEETPTSFRAFAHRCGNYVQPYRVWISYFLLLYVVCYGGYSCSSLFGPYCYIQKNGKVRAGLLRAFCFMPAINGFGVP